MSKGYILVAVGLVLAAYCFATNGEPDATKGIAPANGNTTITATNNYTTNITVNTPGSADYIIPGSDKIRLEESDLAGVTNWALYIARNEIFARHGRDFVNSDLRAYFGKKSWYHVLYTPEDFDKIQDSILNSCEKANVQLILSVEKKNNSPWLTDPGKSAPASTQPAPEPEPAKTPTATQPSEPQCERKKVNIKNPVGDYSSFAREVVGFWSTDLNAEEPYVYQFYVENDYLYWRSFDVRKKSNAGSHGDSNDRKFIKSGGYYIFEGSDGEVALNAQYNIVRCMTASGVADYAVFDDARGKNYQAELTLKMRSNGKVFKKWDSFPYKDVVKEHFK